MKTTYRRAFTEKAVYNGQIQGMMEWYIYMVIVVKTKTKKINK